MKNLKQINEITLNRIIGYHFKAGFIIISSERTEITDVAERNKRFKELKNDVRQAGYPFIPVMGGYQETNPETGELYSEPSFERALFVFNEKPFTKAPKATDEIKSLGQELANKYGQESFLYKPKGDAGEFYYVDKNGNVTGTFNGASVNDMTQEYFTKLFHSKNPDKTDRRFTLFEIYLQKAPVNASEAFERIGEHFYKI
jgi:hypothetical protein